MEATVDRLEMVLFDYGIRIPRPIRLTMDKQVVRVEDPQLVGDQTQLTVGGSCHWATSALRCAPTVTQTLASFRASCTT